MGVPEIFRRKSVQVAAIASAAVVAATPLLATNAWNDYHWLRTTTEITPPVGDNVSAAWDSYLQTAVADWNVSTRIQSPLVAGETNPRACRPKAGRIEVCNAAYGNTGWLGIAQIWLSDGHISQGIAKLNDTYFNTAQYNTPSWRALVMCQEIGHDYGLDHQDEDFATDNTTSCMDYTNQPAGNEHPDAHDYEQLEIIYNHAHSGSTAVAPGASAQAGGDGPSEWGRPVAFTADGRPDVYMRVLPDGTRLITHVFWALGEGPRGGDRR